MEFPYPMPREGFSLIRAEPRHYAYSMRCMEESVRASVDVEEWEDMDRWIRDLRELISITFDGAGMPNELFVLDKDGKATGILWMGQGRDQFTCEETGYVLGLFIEEEHRGKGLGRAMLYFAELWCREKEMTTVSLNVASGNEVASELYGRCGYVPRSVVMRKRIRRAEDSPP